jgi:hypothetical protein
MSEATITVRLHRRPWIARALGSPRWKLTLQLTDGRSTTAEAETTEEAWTGASDFARAVFGATVTSECPFDQNGHRRPGART